MGSKKHYVKRLDVSLPLVSKDDSLETYKDEPNNRMLCGIKTWSSNIKYLAH